MNFLLSIIKKLSSKQFNKLYIFVLEEKEYRDTLKVYREIRDIKTAKKQLTFYSRKHHVQ